METNKAMQIKVKLTKTGKPHKASLEKAKKEIKANFSELKPENIDPALLPFYNRVESEKKRGKLNKNKLRRPNGTFYSAAENLALENAIKIYGIEKEISKEEIMSDKNLLATLAEKVFEDTISITKDTDLLIDFLKRKKFEKITLVDQNGKEQEVNLVNAIFILKTSNKLILEIAQEELFQLWNKISFNPAGKFAKIYFVNPKGLSKEELLDTIETQMNSANFGGASSPKQVKQPKKKKTPLNDPEPAQMLDNGKTTKEGKNKKPNKQGTNKPGDKIS